MAASRDSPTLRSRVSPAYILKNLIYSENTIFLKTAGGHTARLRF